MNILEAMADPSLFGPHFRGPSWTAWRAFLTAAFGLPMDDAARELFRQCTGRAAVPAGAIHGGGACSLGDAAGNPAFWR